jgi:methylated-DNA-[protein]-cysteine S-methyltransferase
VIYGFLETPIGRLLVARDTAGVRLIHFGGPAKAGPYVRRPGWERHDAAFDDLATQLGEYFDGRRRAFELPLKPEGTPFQLRVWNALLDIPYGETISYGELAARIGDRSASRAVGLANGSNPLPIVIPCHRVIGSNGKLTGYGGGLPIKERLLTLEGALRPELFSIVSDDRHSHVPPWFVECYQRSNRKIDSHTRRLQS